MDFRMLESLQRALPIVFRHLDGYAELAERELKIAKSLAMTRVKAALLLSVSALFSVLFACFFVIALTWDTQYRVLAIGIMAGVFVLVAIGSATALTRRRDEPFAALKREWRADRALVRSILTREHEERSSASMSSPTMGTEHTVGAGQ